MWLGTGGSLPGLQLHRVQKQWQKWPGPPISASSEFASSAVSDFAVEQNTGVRFEYPEPVAGRSAPELPRHQNCWVLVATTSVPQKCPPGSFSQISLNRGWRSLELILTFPPSFPHTSFDNFGRLVASFRPPRKGCFPSWAGTPSSILPPI